MPLRSEKKQREKEKSCLKKRRSTRTVSLRVSLLAAAYLAVADEAGTPFMARLSKHLKYYVTKRISEDSEWRNVKVILSGHDVPGEGEHKIQEFIRLTKAQPD